MARPIVIGDRTFKTKKLAEEACREILYGYPPGSPVTGHAHRQLLEDLLSLHPDAEGKIGSGILRFEVRPNPAYPKQRGFFVVRTDGTETDFSFLKSITHPTHRHEVMHAMRAAIAPQVAAVARAAFISGQPVTCALTGVPLASLQDAHVDHEEPTFLDLASGWVLAAGGWDAIPLRRADGLIGVRMADAAQERQWSNYHEQVARLRVVSIQANLSLLTRGRSRSVSSRVG